MPRWAPENSRLNLAFSSSISRNRFACETSIRVRASDCLKNPFIWSLVHPPRFRTHKSGQALQLPLLTNHPINFEGLRKGTHLRIQVPCTTGPIQQRRLERSHDAHREP